MLSSILYPLSSNNLSAVDGRSLALVYTAEGLPEDVAAELAEAREVLTAQGIAQIIQVDEPSGSEIWARWLAAAPGEPGGFALRAGAAAKDLPAVLRSLAGDGACSFLADLAGGLLYVRGIADVAPLRRAALAVGGYAVVLPAAGAQEIWGYTPDSLDLMRALRQRWGAGGLLNPGAFLV
jgi:D-lactate dehydrogenase (cytochrome)